MRIIYAASDPFDQVSHKLLPKEFNDEIDAALLELPHGKLTLMLNSPYAQGRNSVYNFYVDPEARNQGIGGRLIDEAIAKYGDHLGAQTSNETSTRLFYSKGFRPYSNLDADLDETLSLFRVNESLNMIYSRQLINQYIGGNNMKKIILAAAEPKTLAWWTKYYTKMTPADYDAVGVSEEEIRDNFNIEVGKNYGVSYAYSIMAKPEYDDALADMGYYFLDVANDGEAYFFAHGRLYTVQEEIEDQIEGGDDDEYEDDSAANNEMLQKLAKTFGGEFKKATYGEDGQNEPDNVTFRNSHGTVYMYEDGNGSAFINEGETALFRLVCTLDVGDVRRSRSGIYTHFVFNPDDEARLEKFLKKFTETTVTSSTLPEYVPAGNGFNAWCAAYQNASREDKAEMWDKLTPNQKKSVNAYMAAVRHGVNDQSKTFNITIR